MGTKKKNLSFLRARLYMLERRKTDTVGWRAVFRDHSPAQVRSQSDSEYNQKLQGNLQETNGARGYCTPSSFLPTLPSIKKLIKQQRVLNSTFLYKKAQEKSK